MSTRVLRIDAASGHSDEVEEAARLVMDGGLVAFPTETVYGIAVNVRDPAAVRRLYQAKNRAADKPLTIHLADPEELAAAVPEMPFAARKLATRFWPGPLTLVVDDRHGRPTGFRVPDLAVARAFLRAANCTVAATSANPSGSPPATTVDQVLEHLDGVLDAVLDAGPCRHAVASTVVEVPARGELRILREGVIPEREIREAAARTLLFVCSGNRCRSPLAAAFAQHMLAKRTGVDPHELASAGYRVASAGTDCMRGESASPEAEAVARARGLDLSAHRARPLTPSILADADQIYVMTAAQRESILEFAPEARSRIQTLDRRGRDIADPWRGGAAAYRTAAAEILASLQSRLDDL